VRRSILAGLVVGWLALLSATALAADWVPNGNYEAGTYLTGPGNRYCLADLLSPTYEYAPVPYGDCGGRQSLSGSQSSAGSPVSFVVESAFTAENMGLSGNADVTYSGRFWLDPTAVNSRLDGASEIRITATNGTTLAVQGPVLLNGVELPIPTKIADLPKGEWFTLSMYGSVADGSTTWTLYRTFKPKFNVQFWAMTPSASYRYVYADNQCVDGCPASWEPPDPEYPLFFTLGPTEGSTVTDLVNQSFCVASIPNGQWTWAHVQVMPIDQEGSHHEWIQLDDLGVGCFLVPLATLANWGAGSFIWSGYGSTDFGDLTETGTNTSVAFTYDPPETAASEYGIRFLDAVSPLTVLNADQLFSIGFDGPFLTGKTYEVRLDGVTLATGAIPAGGVLYQPVEGLSLGDHTLGVRAYSGATVLDEKYLLITYTAITGPAAPAACTGADAFTTALCWAFVPQTSSVAWAELKSELSRRAPMSYLVEITGAVTSVLDGIMVGWREGLQLPYAWWDGLNPPGVSIQYITLDLTVWPTILATTRLISRMMFLLMILTWAWRQVQLFLSQ